MGKHFSKIIKIIRDVLQNEAFKEQYRMQDKDFTRDRKLSFVEICTLIIRSTKNGLQAGINEFLKETNTNINGYSKAAYCKARQKIHPDAFKALVGVTVQNFYKENRTKTMKGYRILAIDGSDLNLPNTESLLEVFGSEDFANGIQVQAQVSCVYDVLNNVILDGCIEPFNANERTMAINQLKALLPCKTEKDLILMDRGYPSEKLLQFLDDNGYFYLIRTNKNEFFREVRDVTGDDEIVKRECKDGSCLTMRVVSVPLPNGTTETLLTNLSENEFKHNDLAELYHFRWGIETKYNDLKNKLTIEQFSGNTPICIYQDFYATLFLSNLLAFLELDHQKELDKINSSPELKHAYKINTSLAIATLKSNVTELLIAPSKHKYNRVFKRIHVALLQCLTPVRPGRSFPRRKKHPALKY